MTPRIPEDRHRYRYVKAKVVVHQYSGSHLAIFHGPRGLAACYAEGISRDDGEEPAA